MLDVILLERIENLGQMGQIVRVKPGYARNFLLPRGKALRATKANLAFYETRKIQLEAENLQRREEAAGVAHSLEGLVVALIRAASEAGQLYGSVSARDIAEAVTESGITVNRSQIILDRAIKTLGLFQVRVVLHPEVSVMVTVNVARSMDEAEAQLARGGVITEAELARQADEEARRELADQMAEAAAEAAAEEEAAAASDRG